MKIKEEQRTAAMWESFDVKKISSAGETSIHSFRAMGEVLMVIRIEGDTIGVVPCTPEHLPELTAGWLRHAGYIRSKSDLESIRICDAPDGAGRLMSEIIRSGPEGKKLSQKIWEYPSDGKMSGAAGRELPPEFTDWTWLRGLRTRFEEERPLRQKTAATHTCMLAEFSGDRCDVLFQSEDAGRHSAMDKAIGWGILHDVDLSRCVLFTSGRVSETMTEKAACAGVIALTTAKPLVSTGAVKLAERAGLILAGADLDGTVTLFSEGEGK